MKLYITLFLLLLSSFSFSQSFSPFVNVELLNLDCDSLNDLTITVSQDSNQVDMDTASFYSDLGSFNISSLNSLDNIGFANMTYSNGVSIYVNLIVDTIFSSSLALINSIEPVSGISIGSFIIENNINGGIIIVAISPEDGNNITIAGNSSVIVFENIFLNPTVSTLNFTSEIISELSDLDIQNFNFLIVCQCVTQYFDILITSCDDFFWDGVVYNSSGVYTNIYSDINGCDSVVNLNLTISYSSNESIDITTCDDFLWDGIIYTSSGVFTNVYNDVNGCDSVVTLNLIINYSSNESIDITSCDDFLWDSITYTLSGVYTNFYTDVNGCDSVVTLNLNINNSNALNLFISSCNSYSWDSINYDSSGVYSNNYNNIYGCDSIVTIYLTINYCNFGCLDSTASNYDSLVTHDDGSCEYLCYYPAPTGLFSDSITHKRSNIFWDNMNSTYCTVDRYFIKYRVIGLPVWTTRSVLSDTNCQGLIFTNSYIIAGLSDSTDYEYKLRASYCGDSLSNWSSISNFTTGIGGCLDSTALNYDPIVTDDNGSCIYPVGGCLDSTASNYDSTLVLDYDDGSCEYLCYYPAPNGFVISNSTDNQVEISWNDMNSFYCTVDQYLIRYRKVGDSIWLTRSIRDSLLFCQNGLTLNNKVLMNLSPNTAYEYKAKTIYCDGNISEFSVTQIFTSNDLCPLAINLNVNIISNNKIQLNWNSPSQYLYARVKYRINGPGQTWNFVGGINNKIFFPIDSLLIDSLQQGTRYRVVVRTYCDSSISSYSSSWSAPKSWRHLFARLGNGRTLNDLNVYPNPSNGNLNISFNSDELINFSIEISSSLGKNIFSTSNEKIIGDYTKTISLKNFSSGLYFLKFIRKNNVLVKKIILN